MSDHLFFGKRGLQCRWRGEAHGVRMPVDADELSSKIKSWSSLHYYCRERKEIHIEPGGGGGGDAGGGGDGGG